MKILFLCGSLEPGKDGVGDYTRKLANAIAKNFETVYVMSLFDHDAKALAQNTSLVTGGQAYEIRIPIDLSDAERYAILQNHISKTKPDWISLQYVPHAYHPKGLPFKLNRLLVKLRTQAKWHIMLHELWVGTNGCKNTKESIYRFLQKKILFDLLKKLKPNYISTSIRLYQRKLKKHDIDLLPLFGNIEIISEPINDIIFEEAFRIIHFGTVSNDLKGFKKQLQFTQQILGKNNVKSSAFIFLGKGGAQKDKALDLVKSTLTTTKVYDLGPRNEQYISSVFLISQLALSRADCAMVGKSGSTIAMLEHGLPVVIKGKEDRECMNLVLNSNMRNLFFSEEGESKKIIKLTPVSNLEEVKEQFLLNLLHK